MKYLRGLTAARVCMAASLLILAVCGCGSGSSQGDAKALPSVPARFEDAGATWVRQADVGPEDERLLSAYFAANHSVAENPAVHGNPIVFTTEGHQRRFYWLRALAGEPSWVLLEFAGGRFERLAEGTGSPFPAGADESPTP